MADTSTSESGLQASDWFDSCQSSTCQSGNCGSENCRRIFVQKYCSFFGGFTDLDNFERILRPPTGRIIDGAKTSAGYSAGMAFGGVVSDFVRNEIELTYRDNSASSVFSQEFNTTGLLLASATAPASGSINSYSGMYNVLLDVGKRCEGMPHLYVGGGLGSLYVDGDFATATDAYSVQDPSFAYQFIGGLNYPLRKSVDLYTEYRFLGADNISVTNDTAGVSLGDFTFDSHSVYFGVRFRGFR
jgi:opacity protein-like surface antigen